MLSGSNNKTLKVGITGGIGSGKTMVSRIFNLLGVPVYNADERAQWILSHDEEIKKKIKEIFGAKAYLEQGLNRSYISEQVFKDPSKLELLNGIVHPGVGLDFEKWLKDKEKYPYILKEAALLYEAGSYKLLDKIITVSSPLELKMQRLLVRDTHRNEEDIKRIMQNQMDEKEKMQKADYVIYNDEKKMLIPQVLQLDEILRKLAYL